MQEYYQKRICLFSHYHTEPKIPLYVILYIRELIIYFDELLFITNSRELENEDTLNIRNVSIMKVKNEGYDFGMFYKAFRTLELKKYNRIAFINDSNVIFGSLNFLFNWGNSQSCDFWGLFDSYQKPKYSIHTDNYHLQSHFIVCNKASIDTLQQYFEQVDFNSIIKENNLSHLKKKVINDWEIGLSQFLIKNNLTCKSYIDSKKYSEEYKNGKPVNISTKLYPITIKQGIPIIKKRVITSTDLRHIFTYTGNWKRLIKKYGEKDFLVEELISELRRIRSHYLRAKFKKMFIPKIKI